MLIFVFSQTYFSKFYVIISFSTFFNQFINYFFFLYLQFSQSKHSPISHNLSHSHSQSLGFQINLLSHIPLSINSLYSHLYLSSFQHCLLLQTLAFTILAKIDETNFSVSVKQHTTGKVQFQFLNTFTLVLTKFSFWEENWALGYSSMKIWDLLNIP